MAAAPEPNWRPSSFPRRDDDVARLAVLVTQSTFAVTSVSVPTPTADHLAGLRTIRRAVRLMLRDDHGPTAGDRDVDLLVDGDALDRRFAGALMEAVHRAVGDTAYPSEAHRRYARAAEVLLARWPEARAAAQLLERGPAAPTHGAPPPAVDQPMAERPAADGVH